jgi:hypothetical protein
MSTTTPRFALPLPPLPTAILHAFEAIAEAHRAALAAKDGEIAGLHAELADLRPRYVAAVLEIDRLREAASMVAATTPTLVELRDMAAPDPGLAPTLARILTFPAPAVDERPEMADARMVGPAVVEADTAAAWRDAGIDDGAADGEARAWRAHAEALAAETNRGSRDHHLAELWRDAYDILRAARENLNEQAEANALAVVAAVREVCQRCGVWPSPRVRPSTMPPLPEGFDFGGEDGMDRAAVIARIKAALVRRTGYQWRVYGGTGTAWGWLTIAPRRADGESLEHAVMLAEALGLDRADRSGVSIPASRAHYREFIARAEGFTPAAIAQPYWD